MSKIMFNVKKYELRKKKGNDNKNEKGEKPHKFLIEKI